MTKDELIARLQVLGEQLNRDVSLTGTKEELVLRVAELEEELDDTDDAAGQDTSVSPENALTGHENEVVCAAASTENGNKAMKHTELRAAVLDALEKHDTGATLFDGRPAVFDEADFPAVAVYLTGAEYTGEELDSDTWQAELHIEVFLPAQVPDSELDAWMESRIYPVMSDIPALSDLITSMVASGYDYRRDDDAGLWSSADLTYVITYEM